MDLRVYLKASRPLYLSLLFVGFFVLISLLKFLLVRWYPDAFSVSCVEQSVVVFGGDVASFGAQKVLFGMLVASNLTPWGIIERFRDSWEHREGDLGVQVWISVDFAWISGPPFASFWPTLEQ